MIDWKAWPPMTKPTPGPLSAPPQPQRGRLTEIERLIERLHAVGLMPREARCLSLDVSMEPDNPVRIHLVYEDQSGAISTFDGPLPIAV